MLLLAFQLARTKSFARYLVAVAPSLGSGLGVGSGLLSHFLMERLEQCSRINVRLEICYLLDSTAERGTMQMDTRDRIMTAESRYVKTESRI